MDFEDGQMDDVPTRPMRVKILYTFDQEHKTNCLARIPEVLQIPAVAIDESNQVGVIDLKQCINAITVASPELISRLSDGDFTIYAYDYSEYDTPLVGQGSLSIALTIATPNQQNQTMITGRVCQNKMALFSNGVKETLEVKLRLVPVPKPLQNDFTKNMDSLRGISPAVTGGFDPNEWNANRTNTPTNDYFNFDALMPGDSKDMSLVDDLFDLGSGSSGSGGGHQTAGGVGIAETPTDPSFSFNPAFAAHSHSAPGSRAGSPMMGPESSTPNELLRHQSFSGNLSNFGAEQSRPGSRASVRSEYNSSTHHRQASTPSLPQQSINQQTEVYYNEDGQARKRAKVTQTDWRGRSSFGSKSSDLRVTASTAASMHMHRPIPKRPGMPGSNLELPPRVPTPTPKMNPMQAQQQKTQQVSARQSLLRQASIADSDFMSDADNFSDAIASSPEDNSPDNSITAEGTPQEIPSSPPVIPDYIQPQPSSPGLPTLPPARMADSGYMSGNFLNSLENDEDRSPDPQDYEMAAQYRARSRRAHTVVKTERSASSRPLPPMYPSDALNSDMNIEMEIPGDMNQLPHKMLLNLPPGRREQSQGPQPSKTPSASTSGPSGQAPTPAASEAPGSRRGSLALPRAVPPSEQSENGAPQRPAAQRKQSLHRSRTSSNESEAGSPAPSDTEGGGGRPRGPGRSGSGAQRRKIIEQRLQDSIAKGIMPQYCHHCGAIETPTWRRLYVKACSGKPSPLDYVEGEGETINVEVTKTDDTTNEATEFVIRKSMKKTKDCQPGPGFKDMVVCNPCGLWFNKFKSMRPPNKWGRKASTRSRKKQKQSDLGMSTDGAEPPSEMFYTDQVAPEDALYDADVPEEGMFDEVAENPMPLPTGRPRASSMQVQQPRRRSGDQRNWNASELDAALARAVQSSPARFQGSQDSPIEIDELTPKPTRRLLFPSPRRDGEVKSLDDNAQVSLRAMPPSGKDFDEKPTLSPKAGLDMTFDDTNTNIFEAFTFDKENIAPGLDIEGEDFAHLFEGSPLRFRTPSKNKTPKPTPRSLRHLMKTPTPASRKRKALTPNPNAANNADQSANDYMTSPSSARYLLRSTPSRLARTPGRRSDGSGNNDTTSPSPWSRHLAQMLTDANETTLTSPSRQFDFSDLPTFNTPGRMLADCDWENLDGILSSEFAGYDETQGSGGAASDGTIGGN